ncbi:hypothetical protein HYV79_00330 [Candidatus Woesearchaeota archaeon]|nr:hypothetical protein [Candidatus Woesearchaeota archaeon]
MKKYVIIAPVGDEPNLLFVGIKEFPTEHVVLLAPNYKKKETEQLKKDLARFNISYEVINIQGDIWENSFENIGKIKKRYIEKDILINTATGDKITTCAVTSAAFVHGIKAFSIMNNQVMLLPVMKFSYYKLLTDRKLKILELLWKDKNCCASLEDLAKKTKMSLPLISYHINGNYKSEGLISLGIIETNEKKGRISVQLSTLGKLIIKGIITQQN